ETINDFADGNSGSSLPLADWLSKLKQANWEKPMDIQGTFARADLLGKRSNRVVFNIGGNNYRLICKYAFGEKQVHLFVCWIGTHTEYSELCDNNQQYVVSNY